MAGKMPAPHYSAYDNADCTAHCFRALRPLDRNASWLALVELTRQLPPGPKVVTRRYPVDFELARARLLDDLAADYDYALHLGQAPGIGRIHLEAVGINVGGHSSQTPRSVPAAGARRPGCLPKLASAGRLGRQNPRFGRPLPGLVSRRHISLQRAPLSHAPRHRTTGAQNRATFIHVPLAPQQVLTERQDWPTLTSGQCAEAVRCILSELSGQTT